MLTLLATFEPGPGCWRPAPRVLTVSAGSELRDVLENGALMHDLLCDTGLTLRVHETDGNPDTRDYVGTLRGAEEIVAAVGQDEPGIDVAWFSTDAYLQLLAQDNGVTLPDVPEERSTMRSPVVMGVKESVADRLGWTDPAAQSWGDITARVAARDLTYVMTDALTSNSGFAGLLSVAKQFDTTPADALRVEDIDPAAVQAFFAGRVARAESSAYLSDAFVENPEIADAVVNYESELLALNDRLGPDDQLRLIYPIDPIGRDTPELEDNRGAVYADYPVTLVEGERREDYTRLLEWLRSENIQEKLEMYTKRRPVDPDIDAASRPTADEVALPDLGTMRDLLTAYLDRYQRPARTFYVVDVSLSMQPPRIINLQRAICDLTDYDPVGLPTFVRFQERESVTIVPFAGVPKAPLDVQVIDPAADLPRICAHAEALTLGPEEGTAVYDSLLAAYEQVAAGAAANEGYCTSIVLMTDGESNTGQTSEEALPAIREAAADLGVPTFTVRFGEASVDELQAIADATGGESFDATAASLSKIFQQTRTYQRCQP